MQQPCSMQGSSFVPSSQTGGYRKKKQCMELNPPCMGPNNGFQIIHAWNSAPHAWAPATMAFKKPMPPMHGPFPLSFASSHNGCQEKIMHGKGPVRGTESTMHGPISFVARPHGYQYISPCMEHTACMGTSISIFFFESE